MLMVARDKLPLAAGSKGKMESRFACQNLLGFPIANHALFGMYVKTLIQGNFDGNWYI